MKGIGEGSVAGKVGKISIISEIVTSEKCVNLRAKTDGSDSLAAPVNRPCENQESR